MWEAMSAFEVVAALNPVEDLAERQTEIAAALSMLGQAGHVSFYLGPWADEPRRIPLDQALPLLTDARWFSSDTEPNGERLYFVNVENVPDARVSAHAAVRARICR